MSVTLSEVRRAARAHRAPLAGESAGYLVLALADQVLSAPRLIETSDVQLTEDGGLRVLRGQASSETDAELSLRRALDGLLLVASSGSAALMRAGRRESPVGLPALVRELEAALIPVNRAAARRALARLQRETARALASGVLPEEAPEMRELAGPTLVAVAETASADDDPETPAIALPLATMKPEVVDLPPALSLLDGVLGAPCDEHAAVLEESPSEAALTIALDVRVARPARVVASETVLLDEDVEFIDEDVEFIDEEPSDALTVARNIEVMPISSAPSAVRTVVDLPEEACTRPEPVILRRSLRPLAQPELHLASCEALSRTPTLGSLAAELPVLAPELIAELTRRGLDEEARTSLEASSLEAGEAEVSREPSLPPAGASDWVVCSAPEEDYTEPMPEVSALSAAVAIVASKKSDVTQLLADFQVEPDDTHQGLRRAIKELAELDLTPAPFAALIR
jgi:hypothetical protein